MSQFMALPWQADFKACGSLWWPAPRPNTVLPQGTSTTQAWDRDAGSMLEMVREWHTYWNFVGVKDHHQESLVGQAGEIEPVYDNYWPVLWQAQLARLLGRLPLILGLVMWRAQAEMLQHPANRMLATMTVYTAEKTPEQVCEEIATQVNLC
jgi:hypothetical protein